ncbi:hypothetical protein BDQ17DRAFT_213449 [Cyathus striatus]|nr:hypothetical protein BDQ17DRAFT_213449 [Cyathus striatus]
MTPTKRLGNPVDALNDTMLFSFLRRNPLKGPLSPPPSARTQSPGPSAAGDSIAMPDPAIQARIREGDEIIRRTRELLVQNNDKLAGVGAEFLERLHKLGQGRPVPGKLVKGKRVPVDTFVTEARTLFSDVQKSLDKLKMVEAKMTGEPKSSGVRSKGQTRHRSISPKPIPMPTIPLPPKSPTPSEPSRRGSTQAQAIGLTRSATEKLPASSRVRELRAGVAEASSSSSRPYKQETPLPPFPMRPHPPVLIDTNLETIDGRR